jgi:tetratricopeptide (TPR) repeat protein
MRRILACCAAVRLALIVVTTAYIWVGEARAQSDESNILFQRVTELYQAGKYAQAMPLAEGYAAAMKSGHGDETPQYAVALSWLALLHKAQGRYGEAEPLFKRTIAIAEKALGPDHPIVGTALNNLAGLYRLATNQPAVAHVHP